MKKITNKSIIKYLDQYEVLIWDFDGVILDSNDIRDQAFYYALEGFEVAKVDELLKYHRRNGGLSRYEKFDWFFSEFSINISEERRNVIFKRFSYYCSSRIVDPNLLKKEVLNVLNFFYAKNKIMYIASASSNDELNFAAKKLKIDFLFKSILGSPRNKIQSLKEIKNYNNKFSDTDYIFIGDAINDLNAAKCNNIKFLGHNNIYLLQEGNIDYWI